MSKLSAALAWAARGFPVFPLDPNGKEPAFGETWHDIATCDETAIRAMWTDPVLRTELDYNIGTDCTGRVVVDIDVKQGKDGFNQYMQLGGSFDTLVIQTPSGGYHCYFEGPDSANVNIAKDIEIRSHHGYVVAPGSTIDGISYAVITDGQPAWVPYEVDRLLKAPDQRREVQNDIELDTPASIQAGINFLESTPVAIEGQRGDETTFITAARLVRELGLSTYTAFELLRDHWNDRCSPPWQLDELLGKVENAASYGTADLGRLDPQVTFASVQIEPPPSPLAVIRGLAFGNAMTPASIPPRPWLVDRVLMDGNVTLIGAAGSGGKSSVGLALAAHLALGLDFGDHKTHRAVKSIVYNGEDDKEEQSRRLLAVCMAYNFDYAYVASRIILLDANDVNMLMVVSSSSGSSANATVVEGLVTLITDNDVGFTILDPLVDLHNGNEVDPSHMNTVMAVIKSVAARTRCAIALMHHTTKGSNDKQEQRIGNMDIFRGSSSIVFKARVAFTLMDASQQDAEDYGLQDQERHTWVRMDDAKMQYTLRTQTPMWFKKMGVKIQSGDVVGVLKREQLTKSVNHLRMRIAELLVNAMTINNTATMQMTQAIALVRQGEPLMANQKDTDIRQRLESSFSIPVEIREHTVAVRRDVAEGKADKVYIVLY